jgi:aryl-alcohol dehydrogenase-like predicted oxidoreductase
MEQRRLGQDGPVVGDIGLGCMGMSQSYGDDSERDDDTSVAVIHRAIDLGCTLLDTADIYGPWHNERLVGRAISARRDEVVLATKCGIVPVDPPTRRMHPDGRPLHIRMACDASLSRLGVDVIDLYQLHRPDPHVPVADSIGAMADLVTAGKVRAIGVSEFSVAQLDEAMAVHPITTVQSELSLWTRDPLDAVLPWCRANGVGFLPFSPLGRGYLTGALAGVTFAASDFRRANPRFSAEARAANQAIVDGIRAVADRHGATAGQVSLAWTLAQGEHVVPIPGTKRLAYLEENLGAAGLALSPQDLAELDALPQPVGSRY